MVVTSQNAKTSLSVYYQHWSRHRMFAIQQERSRNRIYFYLFHNYQSGPVKGLNIDTCLHCVIIRQIS